MTGEDAFRHVHGIDSWSYRARHLEESAIFDRAMTANSRLNIPSVLAAYDFGRFRHLVDVGGGRGALLAQLLTHCPDMQGTLFDQPHVVAGASDVLVDAGVADRCAVIGGDFFQSVPEGGDAYVLRAILHDWADAEATAILRTVRQAIAPSGRLLLVERVVGPPNEGDDTKFSDLNMLVELGGQERTRDEYAALCTAAAFRLKDIFPTRTHWSIIEAVPA